MDGGYKSPGLRGSGCRRTRRFPGCRCESRLPGFQLLGMEMQTKLVFPVVLVSLLLGGSPAGAWYKQVAGPSYYSVGRASGLLSGIRRSPYVRRAELEPVDGDRTAGDGVFSEAGPQSFFLKTMPVCIKDITPNLQSCEVFQEIKGSLKCTADVLLSLDFSDCTEN